MSYKEIRNCLIQIKFLLEKELFDVEDMQSSIVYLQRPLLLAKDVKQSMSDEDQNYEAVMNEIIELNEFFSDYASVVKRKQKIAKKIDHLIGLIDQQISQQKSTLAFFSGIYPELFGKTISFGGSPNSSLQIPEKPKYIFHFCLDVDGTISIDNLSTKLLNEALLGALQKLKIKFEQEEHQVQFHLLTNRHQNVMFDHAKLFLKRGMANCFKKTTTSFIVKNLCLWGLPVKKVASIGDLFPNYEVPGSYYPQVLDAAEKKLVEFCKSYQGRLIDKDIHAAFAQIDGFEKELKMEQAVIESYSILKQLQKIFPFQQHAMGHYKATLFDKLRSQLEQESSCVPIYIIFEDQLWNVESLTQYAADHDCDAITVKVDSSLEVEQDYIDATNAQLSTLMNKYALQFDSEKGGSSPVFN